MNHKCEPDDVSNKDFCYVLTFSPNFLLFARNCEMEPDQIFSAIEAAIQTRHNNAVACSQTNSGRTVWRRELETVAFYYQILPQVIEIGDLDCANGASRM